MINKKTKIGKTAQIWVSSNNDQHLQMQGLSSVGSKLNNTVT